MLNKPHFWSRGLALASLPLLAVGLIGCGGTAVDPDIASTGSWDEIVEAAKAEGLVNIYTVAPPMQIDRMEQAFEAAYPEIDANFTLGAGELLPRIEAEMEGKSEGADVFVFSHPAFFAEHADEMLDLKGPNVEAWPEESWIAEGKTIAPTSYPWSLLVWNTSMFPDGFKDWGDVLSPEVNGKLGVLDYVSPTMVATADFMVENLGIEYFEAISALSPKRYSHAVAMGQAIGSGEIGVTYLSTPSIVKDLQESGAPIDFAVPQSSTAALEWGAGALTNARQQNAALLFMDFLMSAEGQEVLNGNELGASPLPDIPGTLTADDSWALLDTATVTAEESADYTEFVRKYFGGVSE